MSLKCYSCEKDFFLMSISIKEFANCICGSLLCQDCYTHFLKRNSGVVCRFCNREFLPPCQLQNNDSWTQLVQYCRSTPTSFSSLNNGLVNQLYKKIKSKCKSERELNISKCYECQRVEANVFCSKCKVNYCNSCFEIVHKSSRAMRSHEKNRINNNSSFCINHQLLKDQFCQSCNKNVCNECTNNHHKDHQVIHKSIKLFKIKFLIYRVHKHYMNIT